ncbi:MAG TPA: peptidoglycan-binding protein [Verrucomicrobiae bacterium]|nr:peptidoglycan-binding protein [Verrucomicrobiae bacterium]
MTAKGTKKVPAKSSNKGKQVKKASKLPGFFSLSNKKFILLTVFIVGFVVAGSYWLYQSSSARVAKDDSTVQGCEALGVVLKQGSKGSCVKAVQKVLNSAKTKYGSTAHWGYLTEDGVYGPATALTVAAYQKRVNSSPFFPDRRPIDVDGSVGPQTWFWFRQITCVDVNTPACGD